MQTLMTTLVPLPFFQILKHVRPLSNAGGTLDTNVRLPTVTCLRIPVYGNTLSLLLMVVVATCVMVRLCHLSLPLHLLHLVLQTLKLLEILTVSTVPIPKASPQVYSRVLTVSFASRSNFSPNIQERALRIPWAM